MKFSSAVSSAEDPKLATRTALDQAQQGLGADTATWVAMFVSGHEPEFLEDAAPRIRSAFPRASNLGCTAEGIIGAGQELERRPAVSVLAASFGEVVLEPFHVTQDALEDFSPWCAQRLPDATRERSIVALGDPFSVDARKFLADLHEHLPGCPVIGGMASGGGAAGENRLLLDGEVHRDGLVGVAFSGDVCVDTVVSQGCRPMGQHFVVTQGESNIVRGLKGRPAMEVLQEMARELSEEERELMNHGVFVGRAIDEYKSSFERGDFLIQSVIGADPKSGALAVAGEVKVGTTVQFHVRDARSADEDLRQMLRPFQGAGHAGALLFSCNGRGSRMWPDEGHDVGVLDATSSVPSAGFFAAGELGPVGGRNFIHGFTASIGLFRPRNA